ncbi:HD domain-containing protein [Candidatus Dojkabacteria bacterium]|uniref:HD domain-containing protein n=1 Tax=Candidatus Dojkabacteria bacterium TaxID=2099670 RepID=A0A955L984_9BACT|nr:HD domain-containing protein [Candidatus Dojkabacteria bacterium]
MKKTYIKELETNQDIEQSQFALMSFKKNTTKSGSTYYRLELADKTGGISGNIWENNIPNIELTALENGSIVELWGKIEEFKGTKQVNILSLKKAEEYEMGDFVQVSDRDPEEMWKEVEKHIESIENTDLKELVTDIFSNPEVREQYISHPAATGMHHAFRHGLLEHVLEMLDMADVIAKFYPEADMSLVKAGAILHDIGKLDEIADNGTTYDRPKEGKLLGHIMQGYEMLIRTIPDDFPEELALKLKHIILSHHGILEYGSPVVPKTLEAIIVHQLDDSSAKIRTYQKIIRLNSETEEEFSRRDFLLGTDIYLR